VHRAVKLLEELLEILGRCHTCCFGRTGRLDGLAQCRGLGRDLIQEVGGEATGDEEIFVRSDTLDRRGGRGDQGFVVVGVWDSDGAWEVGAQCATGAASGDELGHFFEWHQVSRAKLFGGFGGGGHFVADGSGRRGLRGGLAVDLGDRRA